MQIESTHDFRASELFPALSPLLFFPSLNDSCRRVCSIWRLEPLLRHCQWDALRGSCLGEPWEEKLSGGHRSWRVDFTFQWPWFTKSQWRWESLVYKWQLPKHFLGENDPSSWHCGSGVVMISSDLSLSPSYSCQSSVSKASNSPKWTEFAFWSYSYR